MPILYQDPRITLDESAVHIRLYYFPFGKGKTVPYSSIKNITVVKMHVLMERWRLWGGGLHGQWLNWDATRPKKTLCIILDAGQRFVNPGITPDDHETVLRILREKTGIKAA